MRNGSRKFVAIGIIFLACLLLYKLFWVLPIVIVFPFILVRSAEEPLLYLTGFAVLAELASTTPPGVMAIFIFLPWAVSRVLYFIKTDISFTYLALILTVVLVQLLLLFLSDAVSIGGGGIDVQLLEKVRNIPWRRAVPTVMFSTLLIFTSSILIVFNKPWRQ